MANRTVTITIKANDSFSQVMTKYNQAVGTMERNTTSAGKSSATLTDGINRINTAMQAAVGVFAAFKALDFIGDMAKAGTKAQNAAVAFTQLAGGAKQATRMLEALREATNNTVSDTLLQEGANRLLLMGLAQTETEVARLTELAVKLGRAMGQDAAGAINDFSLLLSNQSVLRLDNFGIASGRVRERMAELKEMFPEMGKEARFMQATLEQGELALERLGDAADGTNLAFARMEKRIADARVQLDIFVSRGVEAGAQLAEIMLLTAQQSFEGGRGRDPVLDFLSDAQGFGMGLFGIPMIGAEQAIPNFREMVAAQQFNQNVRTGAGRVGGTFGGMFGGLGQGVSSLAARAPGRMQVQQFNDVFGGVSTGMMSTKAGPRGRIGDQFLFTQQEAETAQRIASHAQEMFDLFKESDAFELATEEEVGRFERIVEQTESFAKEAQKGADALNNINLDQILGRGGGGVAGEIGDLLLAQIEDPELRAKAQAQFDLATGRESEFGAALENTLVPAIAELPVEEQITAMNRLADVMTNPDFLALPVEQQMAIARGATGVSTGAFGGPGGFGEILSGDTASSAAARAGISVDELLALTGATSTTLQPGQFALRGGPSGGGIADRQAFLDFMGMGPGAGPPGTFLSTIPADITSMFQQRQPFSDARRGRGAMRTGINPITAMFSSALGGLFGGTAAHPDVATFGTGGGGRDFPTSAVHPDIGQPGFEEGIAGFDDVSALLTTATDLMQPLEEGFAAISTEHTPAWGEALIPPKEHMEFMLDTTTQISELMAKLTDGEQIIDLKINATLKADSATAAALTQLTRDAGGTPPGVDIRVPGLG